MNMSVLLEGTASEQAGVLLNQGWSQLVTWQGVWMAHVPCHNLPETNYRVNLITMECECPVVAHMGPCLHLCLVVALAQLREGPTLEQERHRLASEAYENSDYILDNSCCVTFYDGSLCVTKLENWKCTCVAGAFEVDCVGKILVKIAEGAEEAVTYSVPPSIATSRLLATPGTLVQDVVSDSLLSGTKSLSTFTISVTSSQTGKDEKQEGLFQVIPEQPIIIQTHTGIEKSNISPNTCSQPDTSGSNIEVLEEKTGP